MRGGITIARITTMTIIIAIVVLRRITDSFGLFERTRLPKVHRVRALPATRACQRPLHPLGDERVPTAITAMSLSRLDFGASALARFAGTAMRNQPVFKLILQVCQN